MSTPRFLVFAASALVLVSAGCNCNPKLQARQCQSAPLFNGSAPEGRQPASIDGNPYDPDRECTDTALDCADHFACRLDKGVNAQCCMFEDRHCQVDDDCCP